jgi:hypothetical protein
MGISTTPRDADRPASRRLSHDRTRRHRRSITRAITSPHPRSRYRIGIAPRIMPFLYRTLPNRLWDAIMARMFPFD